jgi:protein O-GlcNAc transferase
MAPPPSLTLRGALACLLLAACPTKSQPDSNSPNEVATDDGDTLPERPPVERSGELMAAGRPAEALKVLDEELARRPDDPDLHFARGIALEQLARPGDAVAAWQAAIKIKPTYHPALNAIGAVDLDGGKPEEAAKSFEAAIAAKPDFLDAHYNLGRARMALGQDGPARAALEAANRLAPEDVDVLFTLTELHRKAGRLDDALATARAAAQRAPDDPEVRRTFGHVLMEKDDWAAAQVEFSAALQKKPDDVDAKMGLARAFIKLDRAEEALVPLADLAARLPDQALVWSEWGAALAKLKRFDGPEGALAKLTKALELKPELASAHIRKIGALADAKQCKQARDALKQFSAKKPKADALAQAQTAAAGCK